MTKSFISIILIAETKRQDPTDAFVIGSVYFLNYPFIQCS